MDRRGVLVGGLMATLSAWPAGPRAESATDRPGLELLEPVYAVSATRTGLTIRAASNGCTAKADFAIYVDRKGVGPAIALGRKPVSRCGLAARPGHIDLAFTYAELGVSPDAPLAVLNPLTAEPSAALRSLKPR